MRVITLFIRMTGSRLIDFSVLEQIWNYVSFVIFSYVQNFMYKFYYLLFVLNLIIKESNT
jgi:hypothetical protein